MKILIVGGGKVVYFLARTFIAKGHSVVIINRDADDCKRLARQVRATVIMGDGSDPAILEQEAYQANALLAVTPSDQDNLVICQLAAKRYEIPKTLALVNDPDNEKVFTALGITAAFSVTRILSSLIEQRTGFEDVINLYPLAEGAVNVTEVLLNQTSPVIGKLIRDIKLPGDSLIATLLRDKTPIIPRGDTVLMAADRLIVLTVPLNHGQVLKRLTGNK